MICPAPPKSFYVMDEKTHQTNVQTGIAEMGGIKAMLMGLSGSQSPTTMEYHTKLLWGHTQFAICSGAAVYEHQGGVRAGASSFSQARDALVQDVSLETYAQDYAELAQSLVQFPL